MEPADALPPRGPETIDALVRLHDLVARLREALDRFGHDSRIASYVQRDIPDARARLTHVVQLTEDAAHRTMDLVERCGPLAARTAAEARELAALWARAGHCPDDALRARVAAHLETTALDSEQVRVNLAAVVLAQGFQDLSGQIIRNVIGLVSEIEGALAELVPAGLANASGPIAIERGSKAAGFGPAVPGTSTDAVSGQQDVDDLLADLGM